jgi:hypothetical protein
VLEPLAALRQGAGARSPLALFTPGRVAAALGGVLGGPASVLGRLFLSRAGPAVLVGGVLAWFGLMAAALVELADGPADSYSWLGFAKPGEPEGPLATEVRSRKSLEYVARANRGQLAPADEESAVERDGGGRNRTGGAAPVAKALPGISGGQAAVSGAGVQPAPAAGKKLASMLDFKRTFAPPGTGNDLGGFQRGLRSLDGAKVQASGVLSDSSLSQLKFARSMSATAYGAAAPAAKQYAGDAFEQSRSDGGGGLKALGLTESTGDGVVPVGGGAPDVSAIGHRNATPYQPLVDQAKSDGNSAGTLKVLGALVIALGAVLILTGLALLVGGNNAGMAAMGLLLIALGVLAIIGGMAMMKAGQRQADQANGAGQRISDQYGQQGQGQTVQDCAQRAYAEGVPVDQVCGAKQR